MEPMLEEPQILDNSSMQEELPVSEPEMLNSNEHNEIPAETIEISKEATQNVLKNVEKQKNKYWHFQFKNENKEKLTEVLQTVPGYSLTASYGDKQNTPDITLQLGNEIVGKIHLLLCDRRDTNNKEKYYCKIYFYHFNDRKLYEAVKSAVINFFESFKSSNSSVQGGKRRRRQQTHKKRSTINKRQRYHKKTLRRN
jgi:hypothetical protein